MQRARLERSERALALILGKPAHADGAVAMLERLAGREHERLTAVTIVLDDGRCESALSRSTVRFAPLDRAALQR